MLGPHRRRSGLYPPTPACYTTDRYARNTMRPPATDTARPISAEHRGRVGLRRTSIPNTPRTSGRFLFPATALTVAATQN